MIQILELVNLVMKQAKHPKADPSGSQHTDTTSLSPLTVSSSLRR